MSSIIHELTLIQERDGWLSDAALRETAKNLGVPLHRVESVSTFYTHFRRTPTKKHVIGVCRDLSCMMAGAEAARTQVEQALKAHPHLTADDVAIEEVSCLGRCEVAPACDVHHYTVPLADSDAVLAALENPESTPYSCETRAWAADVYSSASERYAALRAAAQDNDIATRIALLKESNLRGMGGAGFPTGLKWDLVSRESADPKYVICNADESEPGTFKDRAILHDLPHLVIEGMALAALSIGAEKGWVFIRHEYGPERNALQLAIDDAYGVGALGEDIFGSGKRFDLEVFVSPGGYILGEETALLECMEDKRGEPRNKPPFPGSHGLWGQPTLINNVETFAHVTGILHRGLDWWKSLGAEGFSGHKFISVSGDVEKPDVYLVPMGTTLGELLEKCGGMRDGKELAAIAPGGASSNFLSADKLDVPLDFQTLSEAGSMLGSGAAVYVAKGHNLLQVGVNVASFFRNESCGKCVPCRVGSDKAVALLDQAQTLPEGSHELLEELNTTLAQTSICGLGQVALGPLLSIIRNFPDDVKSK